MLLHKSLAALTKTTSLLWAPIKYASSVILLLWSVPFFSFHDIYDCSTYSHPWLLPWEHGWQHVSLFAGWNLCLIWHETKTWNFHSQNSVRLHKLPGRTEELVGIDTAHLLKCKFDKYQQKCLVYQTACLSRTSWLQAKKKRETPTDLKPAVTFCPLSIGYLVGIWEICSRKCYYVPRVSIHFHLIEAHRTTPSNLLIGFNR